ncbi:MAG: PP2C family protein-serine/threonine phosphatase [Thermoleophilia bacterium]
MARRNRRSLRGLLAGLVAGLAVVLGVLIAVAIIGIVSTAGDYRTGAQRALERQSAANEVLTDMLSAQSAERAYVLFGAGDYLAEYSRARDRYAGDMERLRTVLSGEQRLEASVAGVSRTADLWFDEAVELNRLVRNQRRSDALSRMNGGRSDGFFVDFRTEHNHLLEGIEAERQEALASSDRRGELTFAAIVLAALLTLLVVVVVSRQLWRRVGGPVGLLSAGVGRVTRGRLSDPIPLNRDAVTELAELIEGFNLMQREVRDERDAVAAAARREAAQKTERQLWETVQHGLLPARLPGVAGLRIAARYQPAERALLVGGDFYDAMSLPDGRLAVMVGDMAGHGAPAAAQAAGLRFGWRTLVAVDPDPGAVLAALNAQMGGPDQRAEGLFASIIYMLIEPSGAIGFALAGHPPPFLLTARDCVTIEPGITGPLLGVFDEAEWPVTHSALPLGATIVLYTDGLVEARQGADTFGVERACDVLESERRVAVELRVERLIDAARRHEDESLRDDVVVVAVERPAPLPFAPSTPPADRTRIGEPA